MDKLSKIVYEVRKHLSLDANEHFTDKDIEYMLNDGLTVDEMEYNYGVWLDWMVDRAKG